ncbi:hypothetical protein DAY19_03120 [Halobacteriovorax vibrionivorans]|uniref:Pentapeptide repeat-containing protein n=1 Tax=Halobacteriovorax vibrionivorans TaxID=2152716 RepID=A0ABY0IIL2_9BACT|nr:MULTISPECIES: hypothetical protein [Halobacteriovorax]RZF22780.1 hypothetical protein DAY19_03120 [Halobacteriovorax vibrionivorans]TGD45971.1 hypothetical protein EP118_13810 [Halobacteriovorax sp. Y22]
MSELTASELISKIKDSSPLGEIKDEIINASKIDLNFLDLNNCDQISFINCTFKGTHEIKITKNLNNYNSIIFDECTFDSKVLIHGKLHSLSFSKINTNTEISLNIHTDFLAFTDTDSNKNNLNISTRSKAIFLHNCVFHKILFDDSPYDKNFKSTLSIHDLEAVVFESINLNILEYEIYNINCKYINLKSREAKLRLINWDQENSINNITLNDFKKIEMSNLSIQEGISIENHLPNEEYLISNIVFNQKSELLFNNVRLNNSELRNIKFKADSKIWAINTNLVNLRCYSIDWPTSFNYAIDKKRTAEDLKSSIENFRDMKTNFITNNDTEQANIFYKLEMKGLLNLYSKTKITEVNKYIPLFLSSIVSDFQSNWIKVLSTWFILYALLILLYRLILLDSYSCLAILDFFKNFNYLSFPLEVIDYFDPFNSKVSSQSLSFIIKVTNAYFIYQFLMSFRRFKRSF